MPTTDSLSNWHFINNGPLTTTFTAPESCSTALGGTALAEVDGKSVFLFNFLECDAQIVGGDCLPSGESLDSKFASLSTQRPDPTYQAFNYYSPGLHCPSGWETVGSVAKDDDGKLKTSGVPYEPHIVASGTVTTSEAPRMNPPEYVFADALDNGETAVLCCPSGYVANGMGLPCHSTLETAIESAEVCNVYVTDGVSITTAVFTYGDETLTGEPWVDLGPTRAFETMYTTLSEAQISESSLVAITMAPVITLVHKSGDEDSSEDDDNNDGNDEGGDGDGDDGGDGEDAGVTWGATSVITGVIGVAALAGAALL